VYVPFRGGQSGPHQVCAQCLHQWCLQVRGGGGPTSTISLGEWLVWPIPIKIEWVLQLGFVEAHHVSFGPCEEWEQLALLLRCVESPDIQRHQHYLCWFDSVVVVLLAMAFLAYRTRWLTWPLVLRITARSTPTDRASLLYHLSW
jgi:hypothetical protein